MVFLNLQGWFGSVWLASTGYVQRSQNGQKSVSVFFAIVFFHLLLIVVVFNATLKQRESSAVPAFKMIYLPQEKTLEQTELHSPVIERASINVPLVLPEIIIDEQSARVSTLDLPQSNYQLPNPDDAKYRDVFDPKMRQKLIDSQTINKPRTADKPESWTESDGRVFTYMGDGKCLVSMPKVDSRERGTNWGMTRCGKTDSEKMMDSVMADFESRKNPLKTE